MENPKVSIITTTYNDKENLKKIIAQVKNQDYVNIEYVIVDGGSTDGTLEVIAEAAEYFGDRLKWISEKDKGIYDAINKGIRLSTGDILGCLLRPVRGSGRHQQDGDDHGKRGYRRRTRRSLLYGGGQGGALLAPGPGQYPLWLDAGPSDPVPAEKRL